ncbi:MAG TPA: hypothetical protein VKU41_21215 [Polyangiaceae bacterium]|nr:hypothetical protein [Polyangiaceae bacterium]
MNEDMVALDVPRVDGLGIELVLPATIKLTGMITRKDPSQELTHFFRQVHTDAIARHLSEVCVDVSGLSFVNSTAIRLFIDWASWLRGGTPPSYKLRFLTSRRFTWQATAFLALQSLMKEVLVVDRMD